MMKLKKAIALLLAAAAVCVTFSGCKALDKAKKAHAYYTDKTREQIELDGNLYRKLPECEDLNPAVDYNNGHHTVSQKDVPILITFLGAQEGVFSAENDELLYGNNSSRVYARNDVYGKYVKLIESYKLDTYAYWKYDYDPEREVYTSKLNAIDKADFDLITAAEAAGEQAEIPGSIYENPTYEITFVMCDGKSMLFSKNWLNVICTENAKTAYLQFTERGVTFKIDGELAEKLTETVKKYLNGEKTVYYER